MREVCPGRRYLTSEFGVQQKNFKIFSEVPLKPISHMSGAFDRWNPLPLYVFLPSVNIIISPKLFVHNLS